MHSQGCFLKVGNGYKLLEDNLCLKINFILKKTPTTECSVGVFTFADLKVLESNKHQPSNLPNKPYKLELH